MRGQEQELAQSAEKLRALAAQHAAEADRTRALSPEVVASVTEGGFARHFVPARYGGTEGSFGALTRAVITTGEGCSSAAWCASLAAYSSRVAAHLPEAGQQDLWGGSPDTAIVTGLIPSGSAVPADGGWRLSGEWRYVSTVDFADWVLLCAAVAEDEKPPALRFFMLPRAACTVRQTWNNAGMRATGSHTVVVREAFVPERLSFARTDLLTGRNSASAASVHNVPFPAVAGLTFVAPAVGAGRGALDACVTVLGGKRRTPAAEAVLARAAGRVEAARLLVEQSADAVDAGVFTPEILARNERNACAAAELVAEAAGMLIRAAGTSGLAESQPLERFWRDVASATSHTALQFETAAGKSYAASLLGP